MDTFEVVSHVPKGEVKPIPPMPTCHGTGTQEEWDQYWIKRDAFYNGIKLIKV